MRLPPPTYVFPEKSPLIILDYVFMLNSKVLLTVYEGYLMKKWKKPKFKELRYGFEISMYIMNR